MNIIIGAGLTGLSTGFHTKNSIVLEKSGHIGGLGGSIKKNGFIFDYGEHNLRIENNYLEGEENKYYIDFIKKILKNNLIKTKKQAFIYFEGNYHVRPFQHNLFGARKDVVRDCLIGALKSDRDKVPKDFKENLINLFGEGLCQYFMFPYNQKAWGYDLSKMKPKLWISKRFGTIFDMDKFVTGAIFPHKEDKTRINYPQSGFQQIGDSIYTLIKDKVKLNSKVTKINQKNKTVEINNSETVQYSTLISTIPLPELIKLISDVPDKVRKAAEELKYNSLLCINLGVNRPNITDKQYIYYPEEKYPFVRLSFPMNQSSATVPAGKSGICVEIVYSKWRPIDKEKILNEIESHLINIGIITKEDEILFKETTDDKYSYIIQDLDCDKNLKIIQDFLNEIKVHSIGRYGEWKHSGVEHAILDGKNIGEKS